MPTTSASGFPLFLFLHIIISYRPSVVVALLPLWLTPLPDQRERSNVPSQLLDVALAEACQTRKEERLLQYLRGAGGIGKVYKFLTRQVLFLRGNGVDMFQEAVGILLNLMLAVGGVEHGAEG